MLNTENCCAFEDIIQDDILTPLGLNHTFFVVPEDLKNYVVVSNAFAGDSAIVDIDLGFINPYACSPGMLFNILEQVGPLLVHTTGLLFFTSYFYPNQDFSMWLPSKNG